MECTNPGAKRRLFRVGKSSGGFNESIGADEAPESEAPIMARAAHVGEAHSPARLLSRLNNSFLVSVRFPMSDDEDVSYNTLIDSGATRSFVDKSIAEKFPQNITTLETPIPLELFDGQPTSAGEITKSFKDSISFANGTIQTVEFLVTRLHPTAPVVLGLLWLRQFNPEINWTELSLAFGGKTRISAALAGKIEQRGELDESTKEEEEEHESEDDPILFGINEWLLYDEWSKDYERDEELWRKKYHIGANNVGYSEKAFRAWATKADERSSKLPKYKQKRRWIYKKKGKQIPVAKDPPKTKKISSKPVLTQRKPGRQKNAG